MKEEEEGRKKEEGRGKKEEGDRKKKKELEMSRSENHKTQRLCFFCLFWHHTKGSFSETGWLAALP